MYIFNMTGHKDCMVGTVHMVRTVLVDRMARMGHIVYSTVSANMDNMCRTRVLRTDIPACRDCKNRTVRKVHMVCYDVRVAHMVHNLDNMDRTAVVHTDQKALSNHMVHNWVYSMVRRVRTDYTVHMASKGYHRVHMVHMARMGRKVRNKKSMDRTFWYVVVFFEFLERKKVKALTIIVLDAVLNHVTYFKKVP